MLGMQRRLSTPFLVLLTLPATAMGFALSVQISVLSWILATEYKLDLHEIGIVWAAGPLAGIIGQLLIGVISDRRAAGRLLVIHNIGDGTQEEDILPIFPRIGHYRLAL